MRPRRLPRRLVPLSLGSVVLPLAFAAWLLVAAEDERSAHGPRPSQLPPRTSPTGAQAQRPTFDVAAVKVLAAPATMDAAEVHAVAKDTSSAPGPRLLALRRLAASAPDAARTEAEVLVLHAPDDAQGRFLAVNALATLAQLPDGRAALVRCAARAPTPALREAAKTLLARAR